jgi:hydroxymethylbilane synthase
MKNQESNHGKIIIGTRASPLALKQAKLVSSQLIMNNTINKEDIIIKTINTTGDIVNKNSLNPFDGKGLFTKEIDRALIDGEIDIAAHSAKDIESGLIEGIQISGVLVRDDPRDALVSLGNVKSIEDLKINALVGTSSPRRAAIIKSLRPDIRIKDFRGNFDTRIRKLEDNEVDATILAMAGINRLGFNKNYISPIDVNKMIPAAGQGIIGLITRKNDNRINKIVDGINDKVTFLLAKAERCAVSVLGGSCMQPIGVNATIENENIINIRAMIANEDGSKIFSINKKDSIHNYKELSYNIGISLLDYYNEHLIK